MYITTQQLFLQKNIKHYHQSNAIILLNQNKRDV